MPPAIGSTSTARSSGMSSSIRCSCVSWAQNHGAHPPPVEQQKPVWMPGSTASPRSCEVRVVVAVAGRGAVERRREPAGLVAEDRFEDHACAVVELTDHLVAGHEREADVVLEVHRGMPLDERQVGPADARQAGVHAVPSVARALGVVDRPVVERPDPCRGRRGHRRRDRAPSRTSGPTAGSAAPSPGPSVASPGVHDGVSRREGTEPT